MANGLLAFTTGLMIVAAAISAVLATWYLRKNSYKNAEAAAIFAGIFAFATLVFFVWLQVTENSELKKLGQAVALGASLGKQGVVGGIQTVYPPAKPPTLVVPSTVDNPAV